MSSSLLSCILFEKELHISADKLDKIPSQALNWTNCCLELLDAITTVHDNILLNYQGFWRIKLMVVWLSDYMSNSLSGVKQLALGSRTNEHSSIRPRHPSTHHCLRLSVLS